MRKTTFGVLAGNRDFFPDALCREGRRRVVKVLEQAGYEVVVPEEEATNAGGLQSYADAKLYGQYFKDRAGQIDGVIITLPNFGDEKAIAEALRRSGLSVPVLVQAFPDGTGQLGVAQRRDSFCGKMSVCNNLHQYGIPFSLTASHTVEPESAAFGYDLERFAAVCRIVGGLKGLRLGAIGARPAAFNTVRYSEKLLEAHGIHIEPIDLSEILGRAQALADDEERVREKLVAIRAYVNTAGVPAASVLKMAKFGTIVDEWMAAEELKATAIQCWTAMENFFGVVPCTLMSMMSNGLTPSACEVDVAGAVAMVILQLASQRPSAIVDWNNNYGDDPDKGVIFHCSNLPKEVFITTVMDYPPILASTLGKENTYGTISGRIKPGALTFARVSTDDVSGCMRAYVGEGRLTDDPFETFGGYGVVEVPNFQGLLGHICEHGFEHHVAVNMTHCAPAISEALDRYLGWSVYRHEAATWHRAR